MTKTTYDQTVQSDDQRDSVTVELNSEQTQQFLGMIANPPAANEALRKLMARTPPWETR